MILYFVRRLKLKKFARELRTAIAAEAVMFSRDIKDQHYDKLNQAALTLGALGFFLHVLDRVSVRRDSDALREAAFVPAAYWLVQFFAKVSRRLNSGSAKTTKGEALNYVNLRCLEYSRATSVLGSGAEDTTSALWLAASAIAADVGLSKSGHASVVHSGASIRGDYEVEASTAVGGDRAAFRTTPRMGLDDKFESLVHLNLAAAKSSTGGPGARAKLGCFWGTLQVLDMPIPCPHPLYTYLI